MKRLRFAPSPTGSLHLGNARRALAWLGIAGDAEPSRQSERAARNREAARELGARFEGVTLRRDDGSPTYHLASVVDDGDFGIRYVVRGNDHRPNTVERFRELRPCANGVDYTSAKELLRELKAVDGDLHALRLSLTGRDRGSELAAVVAALDRDETLRRVDAAV